ncbi:hypothetical protein Anapl_00473 [Anas platyrhynchos]|uniref:Uncharacterized protein n=1 Tax=Anas platyrhynchos TaxID=8839 RepID=R0LKJ0_ANAPL|nr:hypothetical protein Anapl_00473 [Anas platyrhynchos]
MPVVTQADRCPVYQYQLLTPTAEAEEEKDVTVISWSSHVLQLANVGNFPRPLQWELHLLAKAMNAAHYALESIICAMKYNYAPRCVLVGVLPQCLDVPSTWPLFTDLVTPNVAAVSPAGQLRRGLEEVQRKQGGTHCLWSEKDEHKPCGNARVWRMLRVQVFLLGQH